MPRRDSEGVTLSEHERNVIHEFTQFHKIYRGSALYGWIILILAYLVPFFIGAYLSSRCSPKSASFWARALVGFLLFLIILAIVVKVCFG
jgi:hypothetical protein